MTWEIRAITCALCVLTIAGCRKPASVAMYAMTKELAYTSEPSDLDKTSQHFIAETDRFEIITAESSLQKSWESAISFCGAIRCEVVSSTISTRTADSAPSGDLTLRVAPEDLAKLSMRLETLGKIASHSTARQDKTAEVIDTDAKIKNLTAFRDNLRAMLSRPSATVKDLIDIQQQLSDTQSELDSITSERKVLANETDKVACEVAFRVAAKAQDTGAFADIRRALRDAASDFLDSTASVITTVVMLIPWLIFIFVVIWLAAKSWKFLKRRRNPSLAQSNPQETR